MLATLKIFLITAFLIICTSQNIFSQTLNQSCSCKKAFEEVKDKVTRIYAGFDDKVNGSTKGEYEKLVAKITKKAEKSKDAKSCHLLLKSYTDFFRDSHVFILWMKQPVKNMTTQIKEKVENVVFKQIDDKNIYLKFSVFNQLEVNQFDSIVYANRGLIFTTPNLIIDMRGNGGGNSSSSDLMIQLIYTNPIIYPAWDYRSSPEIIAAYESHITSLKKNPAENAFFIDKAEKLLRNLKANPAKLVSDGVDLERKMDSIANFPKQVALLIDKKCGSSTEFFIYESKQSTKVRTFGTNTHGVMDYGEDQNFDICDGTFNLAVPWGRNGWVRQFRIDNIGFKPDVPIPSLEKDWVNFVVNYWK